MTKTVSIKETSIQIIIALTRNGDEVVIEKMANRWRILCRLKSLNRNSVF